MNNERLSLPAVLLLVLAAVGVAWLTTSPRYEFRGAGESSLVLSFKHTSRRVHECTPEEKEKFVAGIRNLKHSQNAAVQCGSRERNPVGIRIVVDGKEMVRKEISPSGLRHDSAVFVFEKLMVPPGNHRVAAFMRDSGQKGEEYNYQYEGEIGLRQGELAVMDFNNGQFLVYQ